MFWRLAAFLLICCCVCLLVWLQLLPLVVRFSGRKSRSSLRLDGPKFLRKHSHRPIGDGAAWEGSDVRAPRANLLLGQRQQEEDPPPRAPEEEPYEPIRALLSLSAAPQPGKTSAARSGPAGAGTRVRPARPVFRKRSLCQRCRRGGADTVSAAAGWTGSPARFRAHSLAGAAVTGPAAVSPPPDGWKFAAAGSERSSCAKTSGKPGGETAPPAAPTVHSARLNTNFI